MQTERDSPTSSPRQRAGPIALPPCKWVLVFIALLVPYTILIQLLQVHFPSTDCLLPHDQAFTLKNKNVVIDKSQAAKVSVTQFPKLTLKESSKVIFYHIYLPDEQTATENALKIVKEQLQQMAGKNVTLLYNTIGAPQVLTPTVMNQFCREHNINDCHFMQHYDTGNEIHTLQMLFDYCHTFPTTQRVGYLHNKGSFHPTPINDHWRYQMTQALVQEECWPSSTPSCPGQVCGLYLTTDRGIFFAGNVWTATCSYIRKLLPPREFGPRSAAVGREALYLHLLGQVTMRQYSTESMFLGVGRYSAEWWVGSHPTLRACDWSRSISDRFDVGYDRTKQFLQWLGESRSLGLTQFTTSAPGLSYKWPRPNLARPLQTRKDDPGRLAGPAEYFLLAGRIHRWIRLYGELPDSSSWVWEHYPHGQWWKQAAEEHGVNVLDRVLPEVVEQ